MLTFTVGNQSLTQLTSQYIATLINYASSLSSFLNGVNTTVGLQSVLNTTDAYTLNFILSGNNAKVTMM